MRKEETGSLGFFLRRIVLLIILVFTDLHGVVSLPYNPPWVFRHHETHHGGFLTCMDQQKREAKAFLAFGLLGQAVLIASEPLLAQTELPR